MAPEVRGEFHRELDRLDISVAGLLALIPESVSTATTALLVFGDSDDSRADGVQRWPALVEEMYRDVEHTIEVVVARQSPVAGDLRFLLACIRIVPGLQEVMHLVGEIAAPSHRAIGDHLASRVISLTEQMGELTASTWEAVETGWRTRDERIVGVVRERQDKVAEVRSALAAELGSGAIALPVALEMAVVSRTFERLGHHAGQSARVVASLVPRGAVDGVR